MDSIVRVTILPTFPLTIPIAIHSPFMGSFFKDFPGQAIFFNFDSHIAPAGFIDGDGTEYTWHEVTDAVTNRYVASPEAPVTVAVQAKQWNPATREVTLTVALENTGGRMDGQFRGQLFVTENNLKHIHRIETGCATPDDPSGLPFRNDYSNEHVVRKVEFIRDTSSANPHWGDDLTGPTWPAGETITKTWTIGIDTGWIESNCFLNLVVYKDNEDSLFKSEHLQGISESVTGGVGVNQNEIEEVHEGITLIYPNPASEWVNIHLATAGKGICDLDILDVNGRVVENLLHQSLPAGQFNFEFNASFLPAGIYLCRLKTAGGEYVERIVVK